MKKSRAVPLSLVSTLAAAALAAGCGSRQGWQTCVDRNGDTAVDRRYCDDESRVAHPHGYIPHYFWYYYPRGHYSTGPLIGARVPPGGSYSAAPHASAPLSQTGARAVRGGLGSTASSHSTAS